MFCALFLALIYPAPTLASSSHYAFCWLIVPSLPDVLIMSVWIRTSSPFNLLLCALMLRSFESFLIRENSRKSSCRVFGFLALFRRYWKTEKVGRALQASSTQPWCYKWQEWGRHSQQPGVTGFSWLFEGDSQGLQLINQPDPWELSLNWAVALLLLRLELLPSNIPLPWHDIPLLWYQRLMLNL